MSDYIKREDAIKAMARGLGIPYTDFIDVAERCMDDIPTADVVEVVRCKDCKYRSKEWYEDKRHKDGGYWLVCCENDAIAERIYGLAQDNDYCSYGERKDEGL